MIMNIFVIAVIGGLAYASFNRGFFSSLLNLMCVVVAGAVAFGLWETTSQFLLANAPDKGFLSFLWDSSWALGLALPFAISLAILRAITDTVIRANIDPGTPANYAGSAICGALAGVITAGIAVLSIGMLRLDTELFGYRPVDYAERGNLKRVSSLWVPADSIVSGLYGHMSRTSLYSTDSLARWYPRLEEVPGLMRTNFGDGKAENVLRPEDVTLLGRYKVDSANLNDLLRDSNSKGVQSVADLDGDAFNKQEKYGSGAPRLEGFVLNFGPGAKEKSGQVVLHPAQVRLVAEDESETKSIAILPIAVVAQAASASTEFGRFRFENRNDYVASVGGASEIRMGFEFIVPPGYTPIGISVKNSRLNLKTEGAPQPIAFASVDARDAAISSGQIIAINRAENLDRGEASSVSTTSTDSAPASQTTGISVTNGIGRVIQKGTQGALEVEDNYIKEGENTFTPADFKNTVGLDRNLRVDKYQVTKDTSIVQVDVSLSRPASLLGEAAATVDLISPPVLIDTNGQRYEPIGYVYEDRKFIKIRFTPGQPIRALKELDSAGVGLSRSRSDQKLVLIFRVSNGIELASFALGNKVLVDVDPPIKIEGGQK
jgi:hypothetical protein